MGGGVRIVDTDGSPAAFPTVDGSALPSLRRSRNSIPGMSVAFRARIPPITESTMCGCRSSGSSRWIDGHSSLTPLYRFSTFGALALGVAMTMVGLAERAIEELTLLAEKIPQGSSKGLAYRAPVQADLAGSVAGVRGARAYVADEVGRWWDEVVASGRVTDERKVALGWLQTQQPRGARRSRSLLHVRRGRSGLPPVAAPACLPGHTCCIATCDGCRSGVRAARPFRVRTRNRNGRAISDHRSQRRPQTFPLGCGAWCRHESRSGTL